MVCASYTCYFGHPAYHCMFMFLFLKFSVAYHVGYLQIDEMHSAIVHADN